MTLVSISRWHTFAKAIPFIILLLTIISCQYDYNSPGPGIIEVRLRTVSKKIQFSPLNNFVLSVTTVEAVRNDQKLVPIFGDVKAFSRTSNDINTLDALSRDSLKVMGEAYAPPGHYVGMNLLLTPGPNVTLDGYRLIPLCTSADCGSPFTANSLFQFPKHYDVLEGRTTRITLAIDLDSTLVEGAESYYFNPHYYISSVIYE